MFAFFIFLNLRIVLKARMKKGKEVPDLDGEIGEAIKSNQKIMIYFYTPTCSACKIQTSAIDSLERTLSEKIRVFKVDASKNLDIASKVGVMAVPSVVIIENGKVKEFFVGYKSESVLRKSLEEL